jgi:hypothetical protein
LKTLLIAKAAAEALTGLALVLLPSLLVFLLLGASLDTPVGTVVVRMTGAALLTLGIACWLARNDSKSRAATGLIAALLFYDAAVVVIFLVARLAMGLSGIALWPVVVLHLGLGVWSLLCLRGVVP